MRAFKINYEENRKHFFTEHLDEIIQYFLNMEDGQGFIIQPHLLNPLLKCLETMQLKAIVIFPDEINRIKNGQSVNEKVYMCIKVPLVISVIDSIISVNGVTKK
jgi:hypothetical protein